jgi:nucleotide-binding universal stress UspA family protein
VSGTIVLGFDGSAAAEAALATSARTASELEAAVVVVFAYYISPLGGGDVRDYKVALEQHAMETTAPAVAELESAGVEATVCHVSGRAAQALLDVAREVGARLIVVGASHQSPLAAAFRGSVVLDLLQHADVPVLVVPV